MSYLSLVSVLLFSIVALLGSSYLLGDGMDQINGKKPAPRWVAILTFGSSLASIVCLTASFLDTAR